MRMMGQLAVYAAAETVLWRFDSSVASCIHSYHRLECMQLLVFGGYMSSVAFRLLGVIAFIPSFDVVSWG